MEVYNLVVYLNHKQLFPQNKDPIDRIEDMAQVWEKHKEWKINTQRKSLGKTRNKDEQDEPKYFSQNYFSLNFQTL